MGWPSAQAVFDLSNENALTQWVEKLHGIDVVVHLAAYVHQLKTTPANNSLAMRINRDGTLRLANAALAAGVRRFVFVSTAKVFGEGAQTPYHLSSEATPHDAYACSKWEAEQALRHLTEGTPMELVIIRPPLVYGPHAGANFARLQRLARLPLPLPIKAIANRRDMIGIDNLVDFIALCTRAPAAAGGTWLCSDSNAYSLAQVVSTLRRALGLPPLLFYTPARWVEKFAEWILGAAAAQRLFGSFELDITETRALLQWSPPYSMLTIMRKAAGDSR